jgi:hypothetical protein
MTICIATFSITTVRNVTLSITTDWIVTLSITTLGITKTQHNDSIVTQHRVNLTQLSISTTSIVTLSLTMLSLLTPRIINVRTIAICTAFIMLHFSNSNGRRYAECHLYWAHHAMDLHVKCRYAECCGAKLLPDDKWLLFKWRGMPKAFS